MTKSTEIKGSFSIGFIMGGVSWVSGFGAIGSGIILVLTIVGKSVGFHFNRLKLMAGAMLGALMAIGIRFVLERSLTRAVEDSMGFGTAKKTVEMVWDPVSKSFVMK